MQISKLFKLALVLFISLSSFSQSKEDYIALGVPIELRKNSNAVVRYDSQVIEINDYDDMTVYTKRLVTVFIISMAISILMPWSSMMRIHQHQRSRNKILQRIRKSNKA